MGEDKELNIKDRTYYYFDDMIDNRNFHSKLLIVDKKLRLRNLSNCNCNCNCKFDCDCNYENIRIRIRSVQQDILKKNAVKNT